MSKRNENTVAINESIETSTETTIDTGAVDFAHAHDLLTQHGGNKSKTIRELAAEWGGAVDGAARGRIAKAMGVKYQMVRNVLNTPVKKA